MPFLNCARKKSYKRRNSATFKCYMVSKHSAKWVFFFIKIFQRDPYLKKKAWPHKTKCLLNGINMALSILSKNSIKLMFVCVYIYILYCNLKHGL